MTHKLNVIITLSLLCCGCPRLEGLVCRTDTDVTVVEIAPAKAPPCEQVDRWVRDVAKRFDRTACPELTLIGESDILAALKHSREAGVACRVSFQPAVYWTRKSDGKRIYGLSGGRFIDVANCGEECREAAFKHELVHSLLDAVTKTSWNEQQHHDMMRRCGL